MVRTFVAVDLPGEIREEIRKIQQDLRQCRARLTLVDPGIIHITVKFLGEVDERDLEPVSRALKEIQIDPFSIDVTGIGVNNPRRPRVVWAHILDRGESAVLNEWVESALGPLGFPREDRVYTPHATIARVKEPDPSLMEAIRPHSHHPFGTCSISGFSLKKSTLTPKGPVYETIMEVVW
jgi:RNA 2',3'-cyclic 3'-phosphodiesterase